MKKALMYLLIVTATTLTGSAKAPVKEFLARVTYYYPGEDGSGHKASNGERLRPWRHCAVDFDRIKQGSKIAIEGLGYFRAVDTGSAVISRKAARLSGKNVPVIDVCVEDRKEMKKLQGCKPLFMKVKVENP